MARRLLDARVGEYRRRGAQRCCSAMGREFVLWTRRVVVGSMHIDHVATDIVAENIRPTCQHVHLGRLGPWT